MAKRYTSKRYSKRSAKNYTKAKKTHWTFGLTFLTAVLIITGLLIGGGIVGNAIYTAKGNVYTESCTDSDQGPYGAYTPGVVSVTNVEGLVSYPDYCEDADSVMEGVCSGEGYVTRLEYCRGGCVTNQAGVGYCTSS